MGFDAFIGHRSLTISDVLIINRGDNEAGTTGIGSREGHQYTPKLLERLAGKRVVQLSACGFHTGCLTDSGNGGELELYTFGEGV